jgi:MoxR-like ATPase
MYENENQNVASVAPSSSIQQIGERVSELHPHLQLLRSEMAKVIVGQTYLVDRLIIALLADGHILLEGMPGLAKTLAVKTLANCIDAQFSRIQFTPDLLPADVTGTLIYNPKQEAFTVKFGPIFSNFVLADEINRSPAKVQSSLLEAMQERQVTIGDKTHLLPTPFLVLATQNPIEQEGTYPLPEAQVDRFMLKVVLTYPKKEEEKAIIRANVQASGMPSAQTVLSQENVKQMREAVRSIYLDEKIEQYIVDIVHATRDVKVLGLEEHRNHISYGASPRAGINLALAAKTYAFMQKRGFVVPEDVQAIAIDVLRHRIGLSFEAEAEQIDVTQIIQKIIARVSVP